MQENQPETNQLNGNISLETSTNQNKPLEVKKPSNFLIALLSTFLLVACLIAGFFAYQTQELVKELQKVRNEKLVSSTPTPEPESTFPMYTVPNDPTVAWNTYQDSTYEFSYPKTWTVKPGTEIQEKEYFGGDYVSIISPNPAVTIEIAPGVIEYGFGGDPNEMSKIKTSTENLSLSVNGNKYQAIENTRIENGITKVYTDLKVLLNGTEYHILFGTGYPVNDDAKSSYDSYKKYKETILEILATLKFIK